MKDHVKSQSKKVTGFLKLAIDGPTKTTSQSFPDFEVDFSQILKTLKNAKNQFVRISISSSCLFRIQFLNKNAVSINFHGYKPITPQICGEIYSTGLLLVD